jgi:hypothetical protein
VQISFDSGASANLMRSAAQVTVPMPGAGATFTIGDLRPEAVSRDVKVPASRTDSRGQIVLIQTATAMAIRLPALP